MPTNLQNVSFTSPYLAEQMAIEQRRKMAEALQAQGQQTLPAGQMAGGYFVPTSPLLHLANALKGISGRKGLEATEAERRQLAERMQRDRATAISEALALGRGTPAAPAQAQEDAAGNLEQYTPPAVARQGDPMAALTRLSQSQDPMLSQFGMQGALSQMIPKKPEPFTLAPGAVRYDEQGKPVASAPHKPEKPDEFTTLIRAAGIDPSGPEGQRLAKERLAKMTTHPAAPSVKVDVKTGESLGKEIGPMVAESRAAALGATEAIDTVSRVRSAISGGNVTLGPAATVRNRIDQIAQVMGVAGTTTQEKLVNTRQVARGLAQFTIAARKALKGQGQVSDFEGKLLQRAESGEIDDFTMPELQSFISVTDRLARKQYDLHKRNVDVMKKRPDLQNLVPFYEVPDIPAPEENRKDDKRKAGETVIVNY